MGRQKKKAFHCLHDYNNQAGFFVRILLPVNDININVYRGEQITYLIEIERKKRKAFQEIGNIRYLSTW